MSDSEQASASAITQAGEAASRYCNSDQEQRFLAILQIAKIIATGQDMKTMLPQFLACLSETLEAVDAGTLLLHDPVDGSLGVRASRGYDFATLKRVRLVAGEAMSGKVFQTGAATLFPTAEAVAGAMADLTPANRSIIDAASTRLGPPLSAICVPLITGDTRVGVLVLENMQRAGGFAENDVAFFQHVADLLALSIDNARLREKLQAVQALNEANRLKSEVISTLAHEMRTPLTSIKGYSTALLMEEATYSLDTQREFLQIIDEETDTLQNLIHDLLESSIIDAGFLKLELQPVMLPRLAKAVIDEVAHHSSIHHFLVDFPTPFPIVDADPDRIAQVLRNLLDNAVKYSPQGGLVTVHGEVRADEAVISVADQGIGIAPEHMNRLFEKYFRIKSGLGRNVVGSGLGLPIAYTIVESHRGRIWAESKVGEGSTFYFTLPLHGPSQTLSERE